MCWILNHVEYQYCAFVRACASRFEYQCFKLRLRVGFRTPMAYGSGPHACSGLALTQPGICKGAHQVRAKAGLHTLETSMAVDWMRVLEVMR